MEPLIQLRGIKRSFQMGETEFHALRGIDLDIHEGEFVAVIGPSGSGKSTLMYLLGCLDSPTAGSCRLGGRLVSGLSDGALSEIRNREIGFVFQQYNLLSELDVVHNIALGMVYSGAPLASRRRVAEQFAGRVGLGEHLAHNANELSGGQMQRVAIGRALAGRPRLILADEPTGNLDSTTGGEIMQILRQLHRDGHTIVMVTHDRNIARNAQRIVSIVDGRIVSDERNSEFKALDDEAQHEAVSGEEQASGAPGSTRRMSLLDVLRIAFREGLMAKKGRTFLTMLGMIFGVAAVIAMNGITEGGKRKQLEQIRQIGLNNVQVRDRGLEGASLLRERRRNPYGITRLDLETLREHLPDLDAMAAWKSIKAEITAGKEVLENVNVQGIHGAFQEVANFYVGKGRFLAARDEESYQRVCVVGATAADRLDLGPEPLGSWITIGDEPFRVVGVMGHREFSRSDVKDVQISDRNMDVYVPYTSLRTYFKKDAYETRFAVVSMRMKHEEDLLETSEIVHRMIGALHNEAEDFEVSVPLEKIRQAQQTKEVFNIIIVVIAAISLLVGGIGIMNIMLATVTERTREIGIRRAVGASRKNILHQFLAEALLISLVGGFLGVWAGMLGGKLVELTFQFPVAFSGLVMVIAVLVSMLVGIGFGIYPAWMAARMDPVEALRY